jgi:N-acetyl-1-D-myo-inositol-2-amino-2-deoxy-alpha-D-glucopyranoside deacetylase
VHAHPDDETITTGGTIAKYLAEGAEVTVVTCTLGEAGEVMDPPYALLTEDHADQLGGYRISEITGALAALSPPGRPALTPHFLGGAGRWRDSGMAGTPSADHPRAFVATEHVEPVDGGPVAALAAIIRERRPQVVVTYDPVGGYGHPDHIAAHIVTIAAVEAAADPVVAGTPWQVAKLYWVVAGRGQIERGVAELRQAQLPAGWLVPPDGALPTHDDAALTTLIDVSGVAGRKAAALRAHATQLAVSPDERTFALTNLIAQPILAEEAFILVRGDAAPGPDGLEHDLFAGLE